MTKIAIVSLPNDVHALEVQRALFRLNESRKLDLEIEVIYPYDVGHFESWSIEVSSQSKAEISSKNFSNGNTVDAFDPDIVWMRRFAKNMIFESITDPQDRAGVETEMMNHIVGAVSSKYRNALQVNSIDTQSAGLKHLQLSYAQDIGFELPDTLISNDPQKVRNFASLHKDIIFKPLTGIVWQTELGNTKFTQTTRLSSLELFDDDDFRLGPGIYQPFIDKDAEVRVFVAGRTFIAMQSVPAKDTDETDWRRLIGDNIVTTPIDVPESLQTKCLEFLDKVGLVFAMFDFMIKDGQWIFLEANAGGQFLYMELQCPELPMLDAFTHFLISADKDYVYPGPGPDRLRYDPENEAQQAEGQHFGSFFDYDFRRVSLPNLLKPK